MCEKFSAKEVKLKNGACLLLREAEERDAGQALAYMNRIGSESDNLLFGKDEFTMPIEQEQAFIRGLRQRKNSLMLFGFVGEELVSNACLSCFDGRSRTAHRAEIAVSVRKDFWNLGAGRAAMEALIGFARERGLKILQLQVRADNRRAVRLYESLGFEIWGRYRGFMEIGGELIDSYSMNLYL